MVSQVLQRPTLVLNKSWQPVNVATVARALVMVWSDTARVVDPPTISSTTGRIGPSSIHPATSRSFKRFRSEFEFPKSSH